MDSQSGDVETSADYCAVGVRIAGGYAAGLRRGRELLPGQTVEFQFPGQYGEGYWGAIAGLAQRRREPELGLGSHKRGNIQRSTLNIQRATQISVARGLVIEC